jgi:hypothetical protein
MLFYLSLGYLVAKNLEGARCRSLLVNQPVINNEKMSLKFIKIEFTKYFLIKNFKYFNNELITSDKRSFYFIFQFYCD